MQTNEEKFVRTLNGCLHPSSPIQKEELLRGRKRQLTQIKKALSSPGRNVFIFGERGVGKTSVAQTAANLHKAAGSEPILVACDKNSTCFSICQTVTRRLLTQNPLEQKSSQSKKFGANFKLFNLETQKSIEQGTVPLPCSINEAIDLISFAAAKYPSSPVVVVDEFERVSDENERGFFGDFIKQMGDQLIDIKFIFCGVGSSLDDLLAGHESCYRYLSAVKLDRLGFDPRMEIIQAASVALEIRVSRDHLIRIALISDGFPHYVHLIGTKMFWAVFEDDERKSEVLAEHFKKAIQDSVTDVEAQLRFTYDKATQKYGNEYQYVLWALADHPDLTRRSTDVYDSYLAIMRQVNQPALDRPKFNSRMNTLKQESHGKIVQANRQGWYEFREPVLRGYCRLRAEEHGVVLDRDHYLELSRFIRHSVP